MSSHVIRLGLLAVLGAVLAGAIASAQDRKPTEPAEARRVSVFNPIEGRMVVSMPDPTARISKPETWSANSIPPSCGNGWPARRPWSTAPRRKCMRTESPTRSP